MGEPGEQPRPEPQKLPTKTLSAGENLLRRRLSMTPDPNNPNNYDKYLAMVFPSEETHVTKLKRGYYNGRTVSVFQGDLSDERSFLLSLDNRTNQITKICIIDPKGNATLIDPVKGEELELAIVEGDINRERELNRRLRPEFPFTHPEAIEPYEEKVTFDSEELQVV